MINITPPPITEEALVIWTLLAALGGGVIGCILTLLRRGNRAVRPTRPSNLHPRPGA